MKKSHLYWHRTLYALKKIPSFFRDWEETVSAESTPDLICEAMEERPHMVAKHLAFLMSAPAPESEKRQIWTHVFIKALELGRHDLADLADKHISPKGWTALACVPFNSPALLQKYFYDDIRCLPDFKLIVLNFALQNKGVQSLRERIGWEGETTDSKLSLSPGILREDLVKQIAEYQSKSYEAAGGLMFQTTLEKTHCAQQIASGISTLAQQGDPEAFVILQSVESERARIFEFLAENMSVYDTQFQQKLVNTLPQLLSTSKDLSEQQCAIRAWAKMMSSSAQDYFSIEGITDMLQFIILREMLEQINDIIENIPGSLLDKVLYLLPEEQTQILSTGGPLCASVVQRHTLQKHTQCAASTTVRRKM